MGAFFMAVLLSCIAGFLAAATGAGGPKPLRRVAVPFISALFAVIVLRRWELILLMIRVGVLSMGYGIPGPSDPKPSALGAFWHRIFLYLGAFENNFLHCGDEDQIHQRTTIAVRATLGIQECSVLVLIPLFTGNWFWFLPGCAVIIGSWVYFGAIEKNEGIMCRFFGKNLLWEEFLIHGINTFVYCLMAISCK